MMPRQMRFDAPGTLHHVIVGGMKGCCTSEGRLASWGFNPCRIQYYAAGQPVSQLSQQRPRVLLLGFGILDFKSESCPFLFRILAAA
jgi:hypothetical protein